MHTPESKRRKSRWLSMMVLTVMAELSRADCNVLIPIPPGPGANDAANFYPFLINQQFLTSMRYQQIYGASAFAGVASNCTYVTSLTFFLDETSGSISRPIPNVQINLSTTQKSVDNLSTVFAENVGTNDTVVFGPGQLRFSGADPRRLQIVLDRPFIYNPVSGNLLLDVRVFDGGPFDPANPVLDAQQSSTDEVSRVYAESVTATSATGINSLGLDTVFQISPVPSLLIYTSTFNTPTNYFAIEWPSDPNVFVLQESIQLGTNAIWQKVTNAKAPRYFFPVESAGPVAFYRLIWESGQPAQSVTAPAVPGRTRELLQTTAITQDFEKSWNDWFDPATRQG